MDLAKVGFSVETAELDAGAKALDRLGSASKKMAADVNESARSTEGATTASARYEARVQKAYETVKKYETALAASGVALDGLTQRTREYERTVGKGSQANDNFAKTTGLAGHQVKNLGYQINDVATMLAMGASPFSILASQGGQVLQVLQSSDRGVVGAVKGLGTALSNMLGPVGLTALGLAAVTGAAYLMYRALGSEAKTAEQLLEEHARLVGVISKAYADAEASAGKFYAQGKERTILEMTQNLARMREELQALVAAGLKGISTPTSLGMPEMGMAPDSQAYAVKDRYKAFAEAVREFQATINRGSPDVERFVEQVAKIGNQNPLLRSTAEQLIEVAKGAADMAQKVALGEAALRLMQGTATEADRALLALAGTLQAVAQINPMKESNDALQKLLQMAPKANEELLKRQKLLEAEKQYNIGVNNINSADIGPAQATAALAALGQAHQRARAEIMETKKESVSAYDTLIQRTKDRIEELQLEAQSASKTADAVIKLKIAHDLERAAKSSGKDVTAEMRAEWEKLGQQAADAQRLTNEMRQWKSLASNFGQTLAQALLDGKSGMDALISAAGQLGSAMSAVGTKNLVGGIKGAIGGQGLSGFDPASLAIGGIGALITLWSSAEQKKKAEAEAQARAWEAWQQAAIQLDSYFAKSQGASTGSIRTQLQEHQTEAERLIKLRSESQGYHSAAQENADPIIRAIREAYGNFSKRLKDEFANNFAPTIEAMKAGVGEDSPFFHAFQNVKSVGEKLQAFIADAEFVFGKGSPQANGARAASQQRALSLLQGESDPLSGVQKRMQEIQGTARGLQKVLEDLGMSSADAAKAIAEGVGKAVDALLKSFTEDLQRQINDLQGKGYLNDAFDLLKKDKERRKDDAILGGGNKDLIDQLFGLSAQDIVDKFRLTGDAFNDFIKRFPELAGKIKEFDDVVGKLALNDRLFNATNSDSGAGRLAAFDRNADRERLDAAKKGTDYLLLLEKVLAAERGKLEEELANQVRQRRQTIEDQIFALTNDSSTTEGQLAELRRRQQRELLEELEAGNENYILLLHKHLLEEEKLIKDANKRKLEEAKRAAEEQQRAIDQAARSVLEYIQGLQSSPSSSTLSPTQILANAQAAYNANLALAQGNPADQATRDAVNNFSKYADNLEKAARAVYGSSTGYQDIRALIIAQGLSLPTVQAAVDPLVVAMRDAITAIEAGTSTQATEATLAGMVTSAINAGNAAATAASLLPLFNTLNTTVDAGLTLSELQAAGLFTSAGGQAIFNKVDVDQNGMLTKAELIRAASAGTRDNIGNSVSEGLHKAIAAVNDAVGAVKTAVGEVKTVVGEVKTVVGDVNSAVLEVRNAVNVVANNRFVDTNANLADIHNRVVDANFNLVNRVWPAVQDVQSRIGDGTGTGSLQSFTISSNSLLDIIRQRLVDVVTNTGNTAIYTKWMANHQAGSGVGLGNFALGGWIGGNLHSQGGTHIIAERDEHVTNRISAGYNRSLLDAINASRGPLDLAAFTGMNDNFYLETSAPNVVPLAPPVKRRADSDNKEVVAAVQENTNELRNLQKMVASGGNGTARVLFEIKEQISDSCKDGSRRIGDEIRQTGRMLNERASLRGIR